MADDEAGASVAAEKSGSGVGVAAVMSPEMEALKEKIILEIEAKLTRKEESLWRRGQVEIKRFQLEQEQVKSAVEKMQERQVTMVSENQKLRGALMDVTAKFEVVVSEMREVLRALPQATGPGRSQLSPVPSLASTATSDVNQSLTAGCDDNPGSRPTPGGSSTCNDSGLGISSVLMEQDTTMTPDPLHLCCTPPRIVVQQGEESMLSNGPTVTSGGVPSAPSASPSPAILSLASALQSTPSPGLKLHLADCLDQQEAGAAAGAAASSQPSSPEQCMDNRKGVTLYEELLTILIVKESGFLTLGIEVNEEDACLIVEGIDHHGLVARHNAKQDSDPCRLLVGDRIVEINGVRQDPALILNECRTKQRLSVTVARCYIPSGGEATTAQGHTGSGSAAFANSPPSMRLRPDAEVFVPSAQKEVAAAAATAAAASNVSPSLVKPPGLEDTSAASLNAAASAFAQLATGAAPTSRAVSSSGGLVATAPLASEVSVPLTSSAQLAGATEVACDSSEAIKRMLFK